MSAKGPPYLGVSYYPEVWPLDQVDENIRLMQDAGINLVRMGEFAWSNLEPEPGRYDDGWLRVVVEKMGTAGIAVILSTPTAAPPAWLIAADPEILFMREDGSRIGHGMRRHYCPNHPRYRAACACIVERMAQTFGRDPHVVGWQIDNELCAPYGQPCACPVCVTGFRDFLRERFGTVERLNAAWGNGLWSQTYSTFEQVPVAEKRVWHHPSLRTAWSEFNSESYVAFARQQADILHSLTTQPVGTDMMAVGDIHFGRMHEFLDVVQFNHYHGPKTVWQAAFWFDLCRPLKERPFWNMEMMTSWDNGAPEQGPHATWLMDPGFCRANSWMPIALGGEANLYWHWRQHWSGQELMFSGVITSAGRPMHIYEEVQETARGYAAAADFLQATEPEPPTLALHYSHLASWIFAHQPVAPAFVSGMAYTFKLLERVYRPLLQTHLPIDVILPAADLAKYNVVVSPFLAALDEDGLRERIRTWIEAGGTWIVGPMSDIRTPHATKFTHAPYGSLETWAGVQCKYELPAHPRDFAVRWADGHASSGSIWYEGLAPTCGDVEVLATYTEGPCAGLAAVVRRPLGKGRIVLVGTVLTAADTARLVRDCGIRPAAEATENLLVVRRVGNGGEGLIVIDTENEPGAITLPAPMTDLLTGEALSGRVNMAPYGVRVLKR